MSPVVPAAGRRRILRAAGDWRPAQIRQNALFLLSGLPLASVGPAVVAVCWLIVVLVVPSQRAEILLALALCGVALVSGAGTLTALQQRRFAGRLGVVIPSAPGTGEPLAWAGLTAAVRSAAAVRETAGRVLVRPARSAGPWRQLCYHCLVGPAAAVMGLLALGAGIAGVLLAGVYAYAPVKPLKGGQWELTLVTVAGSVLLLATPWLIAAVARLDTRAATALLGPSRAGALAHRVEALTQSRAGVVDAADAERRRIERDLHDGAQQRLVSLAMNLGIAREGLTDMPDEARKVIEDAHEEAKAALAELRDLVRGLHPAILEDRGLDAALSGIAARAPFPVRVWVSVTERPTPTVEAIAYFVVSEALANITKHARASRADIAVDRAGDILRVSVADDGVGGADPARGTGLAGLARRAGSVDGSFSLSSPAGGPTRIVVELPCAP
jgi:signal transduction histidine kinase